MVPSSEEIIKNAENLLNEEGVELDKNDWTSQELLEKFILPGLKNSKDTLNTIYSFRSRERKGFFGKLKSFVQNKLIHTTINVVEKQSMKQQKFNELVYKAIEELIKENQELRSKLQK